MGESQYLSKYSNQLVELMQPVALRANAELYSAEYEEIAKTLEEDVANGKMTAAEAQSIQNKTFSMFMNPYGTTTSGSPLEKMVAIGAIQTGNIDKPSYYTKSYLSLGDEILSWGAGDSLNENILSDRLIGDATYFRNRNANADRGKQATTNDTEEQLKLYRERVGLADNYNTNSQKLNTALLNATTDIADIKSIITDKGWALGEVIVGGITAWLGAKLIGGSIGKIASALLGGGGAAGALTGTALGSALGVAAGVALPIAIAGAVGKLSDYFDKKSVSKNGDKYALENPEDTLAQTNMMYKDMQGTNITNQDYADDYSFWGGAKVLGTGFAELWNTTIGRIGGGDHDTKNYLNIIRNNERQDAYFNGNSGQNLTELLFYVTADKADQLGLFGYTHDDLKETLKAFGYEGSAGVKSLIDSAPDSFWQWAAKTSNGVQITKDHILKDTSFIDSFNRYGLDRVPYDNYIASLHEGEAVLTSSTASELRNLLTEYRANNQSAINLDVAIQNQTVELVNKLNEVITTIRTTNSIGGMMSTASSDQATAVKKLQYSMTHLISTKSALD